MLGYIFRLEIQKMKRSQNKIIGSDKADLRKITINSVQMAVELYKYGQNFYCKSAGYKGAIKNTSLLFWK